MSVYALTPLAKADIFDIGVDRWWAMEESPHAIYHLRPTPLKVVMYNADVAKHVTDVSEAEATRDFASLLARVREGAEVVIKDGTRPVAVVRPAEPHVRLLSESLRLAREHGSTATPDENFAKDVAAAIESHREPLKPPAWD
jgi:antitoxin (DNA-binding transcriptional repressor) of toxin-antitoxin stability system